jgi:hypothetical protein
MNDPTSPVIAANSAVHVELDARLTTHRLDVMAADPDRARASWDRFAVLLRAHIGDETELVRPLYEARCTTEPAERGGAPEIVDRDHDKLLGHLDAIGRHLDHLSEASDPRAFLALLDRQKILVDLLEHHDDRETSLAYPHLVPALTSEDADRIVARFRASLEAR